MFDKIITHPDLFGILRNTCEDSGICVQVCDDLLDNDELQENLIKILKIDDYFNSSRTHNPPPSIGCNPSH